MTAPTTEELILDHCKRELGLDTWDSLTTTDKECYSVMIRSFEDGVDDETLDIVPKNEQLKEMVLEKLGGADMSKVYFCPTWTV
jgi:hypothetical protein